MIIRALTRATRAYLSFLIVLVERATLRPLLVLGTAVVVAIASILFIANNFAIDTDTSALLSRDLPFQASQHQIDQAFPQLQDNIVAVIDGKTPDLADRAADQLAAWARQQDQDYESVFQPGGGEFFSSNGLLYLSPEELDNLGSRLSSAQPLIATLSNKPNLATLFELLARAQESDPASADALLGQLDDTVTAYNEDQYHILDWQDIIADPGADDSPMDSNRRFVLIKPHFDYSQIQPAAEPIEKLRRAIDDMGLDNANARIRLTGDAVLDDQQLGTVAEGAGWSTGLALGLVVLLLLIALRSMARVVAALITLAFGLIWTTAVGLLAVGQFNILSIAFAVLFIGLSVDFGIQFCMRCREVAMQQQSRRNVLPATAREVSGAINLAGLAAAISFFSVVPTDYSGLSDLGIIAGLGMIIAVLANLTVLPALLHLFKADRPLPEKPARTRRSVYRLVIRHGRLIVAASVVLGVVAIPFAARIGFDFDPLSLEDPDTEAMQTITDLLHDKRFSPYTINILEPDLASARKLADKLEELPTVDCAITLDSYIPGDQDDKLMQIQDQALVVSPETLRIDSLDKADSRETGQAIEKLEKALKQNADDNDDRHAHLLSQLEHWRHHHGDDSKALDQLQQRILGTLPNQLKQLRQSLDPEKVTKQSLPDALTSRYVSPDGEARIEVFSNLDLSRNENLTRFVDDVRQQAPHAAGPPVLLVEGGNAVIKSFIQASLTAFLAISALLWLMLRRWRDVLLALSPLPLAGLLTSGTMTWLGMSFNLANMIVLPLLIGLGVAYGIYFVVRWRDQHSLARTMESSTPAAVLFSALTTACSFGSLALAPSLGMAILGQTLSIALGYILLATMIVLPALLSLLNPDSPKLSIHRRASDS